MYWPMASAARPTSFSGSPARAKGRRPIEMTARTQGRQTGRPTAPRFDEQDRASHPLASLALFICGRAPL